MTLPDSLKGWGWRIAMESQSLFLEADDPLDQDLWLTPGTEYVIKLKYFRALGENELEQAGWTLWMPEGGVRIGTLVNKPIKSICRLVGVLTCDVFSPFDRKPHSRRTHFQPDG